MIASLAICTVLYIAVAGVLTGNMLGFGRVAIIAYLLGTHSRADSLAVAMGPLRAEE